MTVLAIRETLEMFVKQCVCFVGGGVFYFGSK